MINVKEFSVYKILIIQRDKLKIRLDKADKYIKEDYEKLNDEKMKLKIKVEYYNIVLSIAMIDDLVSYIEKNREGYEAI
jgi:hypothetical protein